MVDAYRRIEKQLRHRLAGVADVDHAFGRAMAALARDHQLISEETFRVIDGLPALRTLVFHVRDEEISHERVQDYIALADAVLYALQDKPIPELRAG